MARLEPIEFRDCSPLDIEESEQVVQAFKNLSEYFAASSPEYKDDDEPILSLRTTFNSVEKRYETKWWAGRYIGLANIQVKKGKGMKDVQVSIRPRFGENFLLKIIEDVYKIRKPQNNADSFNISSDEWFSALLNLLRRKMWVEKCAKANRYGLPRISVRCEHQGVNIKGTLDVRRSIMPWMMKTEVCSYAYEKTLDDKMCQIVYEAHRILSRNVIDNRVGSKRKKTKGTTLTTSFHLPPAVKDTIDALNNKYKGKSFNVTENEYHRIRYKSIYQTWKPLVDFSWSVIKGHRLGSRASDKQTECVFVDMAEIWEAFLRKKLGEGFVDDGWRVLSVEECKYNIYQGKFFERLIIPDIILTRTNEKGESEYMVFDAKYKRMRINSKNHGYDVDRTDLFQIHTYIQFVEHHLGHVVVGGLLYPLTRKGQDEEGNEVEFKIDSDKFHSAHLYGKESGMYSNTPFIIDGVFCSESDDEEGNDKDAMDKNVMEMIERIKAYIE